jgi:hypothetical protein
MCYDLVFGPVIIHNIGLYISIILCFLSTVAMLLIDLLLPIDIVGKLDRIIYSDCKFYDKKVITANDYFRPEAKNELGPRGVGKPSETEKRDILNNGMINHEILVLNENKDNNNNKSLASDEGEVQHNNFIDRSFNDNGGVIIDDKDNMKAYETSIKNQTTYNDYEELGPEDILEFDKRRFTKFLSDELVMNHRVVSIFFKRSIIDPQNIRLNKLVFEISLQFFTNALLFTDDYINSRAVSGLKVTHLY